jgi:hypothetical protein
MNCDVGENLKAFITAGPLQVVELEPLDQRTHEEEKETERMLSVTNAAPFCGAGVPWLFYVLLTTSALQSINE